MHLTLLFAVISLVWVWGAVKTWSFVSTDVSDRDGRSGVALGFFAGVVWPVTYVVLMLGLVVGVLRGISFLGACRKLRSRWDR